MTETFYQYHSLKKDVALHRKRRWVQVLTILNLLLVLGILAAIYEFSETWWLSTLLLYLPKAQWAIPAVILALFSLRYHFPSFLLNLFAILLVAWPIMGYNVPVLRAQSPAPTEPVYSFVITSCNVQSFEPNFPAVLQEMGRTEPEIVALQEIYKPHPDLEEALAEWNKVRHSEYFVASPHPVEYIAECHSEAFNRVAAVAVDVKFPQETVRVFNIHLMTIRKGLSEYANDEDQQRNAQAQLESHSELRKLELDNVAEFIEQYRSTYPILVVGDFNMPTSSSLYQTYWAHYQNVFDLTQWGYGYTSPVTKHKYWMKNSPWLRIDHILVDDHWIAQDYLTGKSTGSDHRVVAARVGRNRNSTSETQPNSPRSQNAPSRSNPGSSRRVSVR